MSSYLFLEPELFYTAFIVVCIFYLLVFFVSKWIYDLNSPQERAAFWHSVTRYLTLALVISTFSVYTFGISMLLPIMFAYVVQIPLSVYINKKCLNFPLLKVIQAFFYPGHFGNEFFVSESAGDYHISLALDYRLNELWDIACVELAVGIYINDDVSAES